MNWEKYESIRSSADHREYNAAKQRAYRARKAEKESAEKPPQTPPKKEDPKPESYTESESGRRSTRGNALPTRGNARATLEESKAYAEEIGIGAAEGESFWNYFESIGWVVGNKRAPMKDWKAALRNWRKNVQKSGQPSLPLSGAKSQSAGSTVFILTNKIAEGEAQMRRLKAEHFTQTATDRWWDDEQAREQHRKIRLKVEEWKEELLNNEKDN